MKHSVVVRKMIVHYDASGAVVKKKNWRVKRSVKKGSQKKGT